MATAIGYDRIKWKPFGLLGKIILKIIQYTIAADLFSKKGKFLEKFPLNSQKENDKIYNLNSKLNIKKFNRIWAYMFD